MAEILAHLPGDQTQLLVAEDGEHLLGLDRSDAGGNSLASSLAYYRDNGPTQR